MDGGCWEERLDPGGMIPGEERNSYALLKHSYMEDEMDDARGANGQMRVSYWLENPKKR